MQNFVFKVLGIDDIDNFHIGEHEVFGNFEAWSIDNCRAELSSEDRYYIGLYLQESKDSKLENFNALLDNVDNNIEKNLEECEIARKYMEKYGYNIQKTSAITKQEAVQYSLVAWAGITTFNESDLMTIAVTKDCRGLGLASYLLEKLIEKAESLKLRTMFLEVRESNESAIHVYGKLGFKKIGLRKNYYKLPTENAVIMERPINKIGVVGAEVVVPV